MEFRNVIIILALCILLSACTTPGTVRPTNNSSLNTTPPVQGVPSDFSLSIERGFCYGECPRYDVMIDAEGTVHGNDSYTPVKGNVILTRIMNSNVNASELRSLFDKVEQIQFFGMKDEYTEPKIADGYEIKYSCTLNGKTKSIIVSSGGDDTKKLNELRILFESAIGMKSGVYSANDTSVKCGSYRNDDRSVMRCAICGDGVCDPYEHCTSSSSQCDYTNLVDGVPNCRSTSDCGAVYCSEDCSSSG